MKERQIDRCACARLGIRALMGRSNFNFTSSVLNMPGLVSSSPILPSLAVRRASRHGREEAVELGPPAAAPRILCKGPAHGKVPDAKPLRMGAPWSAGLGQAWQAGGTVAPSTRTSCGAREGRSRRLQGMFQPVSPLNPNGFSSFFFFFLLAVVYCLLRVRGRVTADLWSARVRGTVCTVYCVWAGVAEPQSLVTGRDDFATP